MKYTEPLLSEQFYHIYNHAIGNENLFRNAENYQYFLKRYADFISPIASTYAYCLLPNHFHFLIRIKSEIELLEYYKLKYVEAEKKPEFVVADFAMQQFSNFFNAYAKAFNKSYKRKGALFLDYMKRKSVTDEKYLSNLLHYIHYNPVHHGICKKIGDWDYTSFHAHISQKPTRLNRDEVLKWFGGKEKMVSAHGSKPVGISIEEIEFY
jgi:REP element-mobilizing transposase RayT